MKALYFEKHGSTSELRYGNVPDPHPGPGELLVQVHACALNHLDLWILKGWSGLKLQFPHVGGADIAGEVIACGKGVSTIKPGNRVALIPGFISPGDSDEWITRGEDSLSPNYKIFGESRAGGFAQYVVAPEHTALLIPPTLPYSAGAAPLLVATTAWRMLKHCAKIQPGHRVLIVGAGGGLNSFTISLANDCGAEVIALTSTEEKCEKAKSLGARSCVNYRTTPDWSRKIRELTSKQGVDIVIDNVGSTFEQSLLSLKRGGKLITVGNTSGPRVNFDNRLIFGKQLSIIGSTMGSMQDTRDAMCYAWSQNPEKWIDREIPLRDGVHAYETLERGEQFGKIILVP